MRNAKSIYFMIVLDKSMAVSEIIAFFKATFKIAAKMYINTYWVDFISNLNQIERHFTPPDHSNINAMG